MPKFQLSIFSIYLGNEMMDRHVTPIALVFDELKDYLSESDLSLDYKIARSRSKKKKLLTNRNSRLFNNPNLEVAKVASNQGI
jgi:hypothetical protein